LKNYRLVSLVLLLLICLLAACAPKAGAPPPKQPKKTKQDSESFVRTFEGISSFTGKAGKYSVECEDCTATVINNVVCQATKHDGRNGNDYGTDVIPVISVSHNGEIQQNNNISTTDASGLWVIKDQMLRYIRDGERPENLKCYSEAEFTVLMRSGGTITKFP